MPEEIFVTVIGESRYADEVRRLTQDQKWSIGKTGEGDDEEVYLVNQSQDTLFGIMEILTPRQALSRVRDDKQYTLIRFNHYYLTIEPRFQLLIDGKYETHDILP